jgi:aryl-alcohol dehydrogenase
MTGGGRGMQVRAAVARAEKADFRIEELELAELQPEEVYVRIAGVGFCHTDIVSRDQILPFPLPCVLGHEGAGVVERTGSAVTRVAEGDHVVISFSFCGVCDNCLDGHPAYCRDFYRLNFGTKKQGSETFTDAHGCHVRGNFFGQSSFATHAVAHQRHLVPIDRDVPLEIAGPLGCSIQTGAGAVLNVLKPKEGSSIAILGAGAVGLAALLAARICGCSDVLVFDRRPERLKLASELGATQVYEEINDEVGKLVRSRMQGGVDFSVECTGVPAVVRQAMMLLKQRGSCCAVGSAPVGTDVNIDLGHLLSGRTLCGTMEGDSNPALFIPQLLEYWKQGRFPFERLLRFYALDDINRAVHDVERGETIKAVLRP